MEYLYVTFFIFLILYTSIFNKQKDLTLFVVFVLSFGLCAVKLMDKSPDIIAYNGIYNNGEERIEPLYLMLCRVCKYFNLDFVQHIFVVISMCCIMKSIVLLKMSSYPMMSLLVWMSNLFIMQEMIAYRASIASGFILFSIYLRTTDRRLLSYLSLALAFGFHYTSLIALPLLFISSTKKYSKFYICLLLFSYLNCATIKFDLFPFISLLRIEGINTLREMYEDNISANPFNLVQVSKVAICLFLWYNSSKLKNENSVLFLKMYTLGCCMFPLFFNYVTVAIRLADLLMTSTFFLYPEFQNCIKNRFGKFSTIATCAFLGYYSITSFVFRT